jgi:hypothetical protein
MIVACTSLQAQERNTCGEKYWTTQERSHPMGDKKGKKDKAKEQRQQASKQTKASKQKQGKQEPRTP